MRTRRGQAKRGEGSPRAERGNESLTRTSDAVRHEARPVDTPRFVASHPRSPGLLPPSRVQLSRGSCARTIAGAAAFPLYFPPSDAASRRIECRVTDLINDLVRRQSILPGTFEGLTGWKAIARRLGANEFSEKDPRTTQTGRGETSEDSSF